MNRSIRTLFSTTLVLSLASCVDHRPIRNGLGDESIYLTKEALTRPNPKLGASATDDAWLSKVTIVEASSPNVVGDYAFPGFESETQVVKFRFRENVLQMLDGRVLQTDDPKNANDDLATATERVVMEWKGEHVDIKLMESLDGERTNFLEENREAKWQERQKFKVDFETTSLDPITSIAWFYGEFLHDCAHVVSTNLVPDSYEEDFDADQYFSFVLEVNYELAVDPKWGACYDLVSLAHDVGTATIQYRFSFYRPGPSDFPTEVIDEKDPVNKRFGAFQVLNLFRDSETGLLGAKSLLQRWNPNREEPAVYYFHEGFPPRFKPMFATMKTETNRALEAAGATLRIDFREWNDGGIERHLGDLRHSFVVWHQDIDTTRGLLGYGPSAVDPRTGEILSANVHLYNVGLDWYRFLIQDFLEENGGLAKPDAARAWEEIPCTAGETTAPVDATLRLRSTMFDEMRRVMDLETASANGAEDFIPQPAREKERFLADYHRMLGEFRYVEPTWNAYVYQPAGRLPMEGFTERLAVEREFKKAMGDILMNRDPFGATPRATRAGIEAEFALVESFRKWRTNHDRLEADRDFVLGKRNIYLFDENDALGAISTAARQCAVDGFWESDVEYSERIIESVVFHVAIHELGHTLSLRHNFYGSVDAKHMREGEVAASVMDYVKSSEEAGTPRAWGAYDEAALQWIYGTKAVRDGLMTGAEHDYLYCTDEHRFRSPLCTAHDLGITPAQITLNAIERYDWLYSIRNERAFRKFWDTSHYIDEVYSAIFPLMRMWYLAIFDWGGGGIQDVLKRLDQVDASRTVLTDPEYDEIAADYYNDVAAANGLILAFYDAVINQPASFRDYQTKFDPYYGDILRLGIFIDKLFTNFAFMDLQYVDNYNPNIETLVAMYDAPFGEKNSALSKRVLDDMLGSSYDTFEWFRYMSIGIFAAVTNTNLVDAAELKERIAISRYENEMEFIEVYGQAAFDEALARDNPAQIFVHEGEEYVYTFLGDRGWHLVASRSRSPVSYQFMRDYNDRLNSSAEDGEDNYGLKILLAYYEYYNNFQGF